MSAKKKQKAVDPNNPPAKRAKIHKTKKKSNPIDTLSANQISFFKAKYLCLVTEVYAKHRGRQNDYKKVGVLIKNLIAADIVLQYLENHNLPLTIQSAIFESSKDLERKFTDIWIARKLQIRGKHDIMHGLISAKKNNKFNIGFHGRVGGSSKNNSSNNPANEIANVSKSNKNSNIEEPSEAIKLLNVRVVDPKNQDEIKKFKKKKSSTLQSNQEIEEELYNKPKSTKKGSKKSTKNQSNDEINQSTNSTKKKRAKKDKLPSLEPNSIDDKNSNPQQREIQYIENISKKIKTKANKNKNNETPISNQHNNGYNYRNDNNNQDIDLNELPPPLGTDSSDDNDGLYDMNNRYDYDVKTSHKRTDNADHFYDIVEYNDDVSNDNNRNFNSNDLNDRFNNKYDNFNPRYYNRNESFNPKYNNKNTNYNNRYNNNEDYYNDNYHDKNDSYNNRNGNFNGRFNNRDNDFNDKFDDYNNNYNDRSNNPEKEIKSGRTRVKTTGTHTHNHTGSVNNNNNNNNPNRTKIKQRSYLNEESHFYTYTYEEEDDVSESTQYEYPTHIYEYEDFDEEEDKNKNNNNSVNNKNNQTKFASKNKNYEFSLITGEIEIVSEEIEDLKPIYPSNNNNNRVISPTNLGFNNKFQNIISNQNSPSSGSPQNHSTSSNSLHEQKIKLTLQQNVEMIQAPTQEETKTKTKQNSDISSIESSQIQEYESTTVAINLVFQTFHTVDVQPNLEMQRLFKQRKGIKQKETPNSKQNSCEQIYFPLQNKNDQISKQQQNEPSQNNESEYLQEAFNVHIKILEAEIFKDSGFESSNFKVRTKLFSAKEFAETRESTPSAVQQSPETNQLIVHHSWDEAFKIFCNRIDEKINVSVLAQKYRKQQNQKVFDVVSDATIALKSFVVDEISDVWINMKNIGRIHLLICIKRFDPDEYNYDMYDEEEEEEEEAEMSENQGIEYEEHEEEIGNNPN